MKALNDLKWSDLVSPTITPEKYLKIYKDKIIKVYEKYEPKSDVLDKIKD